MDDAGYTSLDDNSSIKTHTTESSNTIETSNKIDSNKIEIPPIINIKLANDKAQRLVAMKQREIENEKFLIENEKHRIEKNENDTKLKMIKMQEQENIGWNKIENDRLALTFIIKWVSYAFTHADAGAICYIRYLKNKCIIQIWKRRPTNETDYLNPKIDNNGYPKILELYKTCNATNHCMDNPHCGVDIKNIFDRVKEKYLYIDYMATVKAVGGVCRNFVFREEPYDRPIQVAPPKHVVPPVLKSNYIPSVEKNIYVPLYERLNYVPSVKLNPTVNKKCRICVIM